MAMLRRTCGVVAASSRPKAVAEGYGLLLRAMGCGHCIYILTFVLLCLFDISFTQVYLTCSFPCVHRQQLQETCSSSNRRWAPRFAREVQLIKSKMCVCSLVLNMVVSVRSPRLAGDPLLRGRSRVFTASICRRRVAHQTRILVCSTVLSW